MLFTRTGPGFLQHCRKEFVQLASAYQLGPPNAPGGHRAAAYDDDDPEEFRLEYFKPGFVADSHALRKVLRSADTPPAAMRLLVSIADLTTGYRVEWSAIRRQYLMEHADIQSRSTFQDAKRWLLDAGYIRCYKVHYGSNSKDAGYKESLKDGCTAYALGESLRVLLRPEEREARRGRRRGLKVVPDQGGIRPAGQHVSGEPDPMIKKQENQDQQHRPSAPPVPEPFGDDELFGCIEQLEREWNEPNETPDHPEPTCAPRDTARHAPQEQPARSAEQGRLVAQLTDLGVHERVAQRLAQTQTADVIASAIARLPKVDTKNPAGYLVAEISRGGYKEPDRTKPLRVYHDEIHEKRKAEREREAEAKEQSSRTTTDALDRYAQLLPDHQAELTAALHHQAHAEGFTRLPGWSESHPLYRGLLAELVAEWITRNTAASRTNPGFQVSMSDASDRL